MSLIYSVECAVCGTDLSVSKVSLDYDNDLTVVVDPCQNCLDDSFEKGKEDGKSDCEDCDCS